MKNGTKVLTICGYVELPSNFKGGLPEALALLTSCQKKGKLTRIGSSTDSRGGTSLPNLMTMWRELLNATSVPDAPPVVNIATSIAEYDEDTNGMQSLEE